MHSSCSYSSNNPGDKNDTAAGLRGTMFVTQKNTADDGTADDALVTEKLHQYWLCK